MVPCLRTENEILKTKCNPQSLNKKAHEAAGNALTIFNSLECVLKEEIEAAEWIKFTNSFRHNWASS